MTQYGMHVLQGDSCLALAAANDHSETVQFLLRDLSSSGLPGSHVSIALCFC